MKLENYFDFLASDDIRLRGTRIGIETILYDYIHRSQAPEAIAARYPSLTLEQVYATITYYLHNRQQVEAYLADWLAYCRQAREEQDHNPPPVVARLRSLAAERRQRQAAPAAGSASNMNLVRYLLDEHVDPVLRTQLLRHEPDMAASLPRPSGSSATPGPRRVDWANVKPFVCGSWNTGKTPKRPGQAVLWQRD